MQLQGKTTTNQPTNKQTTNNNAAFPENCLIHGRVYLIAPHCNTLMNCSNIGENVQLRPETPVLNCAKHSYKRGNIIPWMSFFTDLKLVFRATTVYTKKQLTMHQAFWWPWFDVSFSSSTSNRLQDLWLRLAAVPWAINWDWVNWAITSPGPTLAMNPSMAKAGRKKLLEHTCQCIFTSIEACNHLLRDCTQNIVPSANAAAQWRLFVWGLIIELPAKCHSSELLMIESSKWAVLKATVKSVLLESYWTAESSIVHRCP